MGRRKGSTDLGPRMRRGDRAEIEHLKTLPLTETGRRILMRHAMTTRTGLVGASELADLLHCHELTVWRILKKETGCWYEKERLAPIADRLYQLLRCDRSWLFHTIDYGDLEEVSFDLDRHHRWRIRDRKREESHV